MPRPADRVGFQYAPPVAYGAVDCRCMYESGAVAAGAGTFGGGSGRPEPYEAALSVVSCYPAKVRLAPPSESPSIELNWDWITRPTTVAPTASPVTSPTASPLPPGVSVPGLSSLTIVVISHENFDSSQPFIYFLARLMKKKKETRSPTRNPTQSPLEPSASPTTARPTSPPTAGPSGSPSAYCPSLNKKKCTKSPICVRVGEGEDEVCVAGTYAPTEPPTDRPSLAPSSIAQLASF